MVPDHVNNILREKGGGKRNGLLVENIDDGIGIGMGLRSKGIGMDMKREGRDRRN